MGARDKTLQPNSLKIGGNVLAPPDLATVSCPMVDIIQHQKHVSRPGRYVGAAAVEDHGEPLGEKMEKLKAPLREQAEKADQLDRIIWANLEDIGCAR